MACDKIAGAHKLYYAPFGVTAVTYLGTTGDEGIRQVREMLWDQIHSDSLGPEADVDAVFVGQNMTLDFVLQDVNLDIVQMFLHPAQCEYTSTAVTSVAQEKYGVAGRLACGMLGTLEAIPVAFTPAQSFSGGSAAGTAGVYPGTSASSPLSGRKYYGINILEVTEEMGAKARFIPARFKCYPWDDSGTTKMWKWISTFTT